MHFIKIQVPASPSEFIQFLSDNNKVNSGVRFDETRGKPHMNVIEKKGNVRITCEMLGRATKDNAFGYLVGTYFTGRLIERNGVLTLKGVVLTAPIYHAFLAVLLFVLVYKSIQVGGVSLIPLFLLAFEVIMFKDEFRKQGYIKRYLNRAVKKFNKQI